MLYSKFIYHAKEMTIKQLENETWYLDPEWKYIIRDQIESDLNDVEDNPLDDWWDVENILELEVTRRNAKDDKKKDVIDWLYDLITAYVEPAVLSEENDFIKNMVEFMKTNHAIENENTPDNIVPFPTSEDS